MPIIPYGIGPPATCYYTYLHICGFAQLTTTVVTMFVMLSMCLPVVAAAFSGGRASWSCPRTRSLGTAAASASVSAAVSAAAPATSTALRAEKNAHLGMGCFWKPSETMLSVPGVSSTMAGYSGGGKARNQPPSYSDVCASRDWVETVRVTYDDDIITYPELLDAYFEAQEAKLGSRQYAPIIFAAGEEQMVESEAWLTQAREEQRVGKGGIPALAVTVEPATKFFKAEGYHQSFWQKSRPRFALGFVLLAISSGVLDSIIPNAEIAHKVESAANYVFLAGALALQAERWIDKDVEELPMV